MLNQNKYTIFEIAEFVSGYSTDGQYWYDVDDIEGILKNALAMLRDEQDGIEVSFRNRRKEMSS